MVLSGVVSAEKPLQLHTGFRKACALHVFLVRLQLCCDHVTSLPARNATAGLSCIYVASFKWNSAAYKCLVNNTYLHVQSTCACWRMKCTPEQQVDVCDDTWPFPLWGGIKQHLTSRRGQSCRDSFGHIQLAFISWWMGACLHSWNVIST